MTKAKLITIAVVLLGAIAGTAQQTGVIDICPKSEPAPASVAE